MTRTARLVCVAAELLLLTAVCHAGRRAEASRTPEPSGPSELEVQAVVMEMADDYIAALGGAIYLMTDELRHDPRARWLAQSFLRNGVGAAVDIASGPNPDVALLDMVVLVSLQTWAFETRWTEAGIDHELASATVSKLREAETQAWSSAGRILTDEQRANLRELIAAWIEANPDQVVVSFVRFDDFTRARMAGGQATRTKASGLLRQLRNATVAVESALLFGERLLWFAGRYPYILGEQAELTAYRLADQPEFRSLVESMDEATEVSRSLARTLDGLDDERRAAIEQSEQALGRVTRDAVSQAFDRLSGERTALLDDIQSRQAEIDSVLKELGRTIDGSTTLAQELTGTVGALDRLVGRFDRDPQDGREPLELWEVRDTLVEATRTMETLAALLDRTDQTLLSDAWENRIDRLEGLSGGLVDRAFHRGLVLVAVLLVGLALVRLIPTRQRRSSAAGG